MASATGANLPQRRRASSFSASPSANPAGVRKRMPSSVSYTKLLCVAFAAACLLALGVAGSASAAKTSGSGGATFEPPPPPPEKATLVDGRVIAPASAPDAREARDRGGQPPGREALHLRRRPQALREHRRQRRLDRGYDCSGAVSYALYGGRFLRSPLPSGALMDWGATVPASGSPSTPTAATPTSWWRACASTPRCATPTPPARAAGRAGASTLRRSDAFVARHPRGY